METYRRLLAYTRPYMNKIILSLICSVLVAGSTSLAALIVEPAIDKIFMEQDQAMLMYIPLAVLLIIGIKGLASFGQVYFIEYVGQHIIFTLRQKLFRHIQSLSLNFFAHTQTGTLVSRITNDVTLLQSAAATIIADAIRQGFSTIGLLVVVFYQHWRLALIALLILPVAIGFVAYIGRKMRQTSRKLQMQMADINNLLYEKISGIRIVKAFGAEEIEGRRFSDTIQHFLLLALDSVRLNAINSSLSEVLGGLGIAAVIWYGGYEVIHGITTPGTFMSFITALLLLYEPLKRISKYNIKIQHALAAADRVFEILDTEPDIQEMPNAAQLRPIQHSIEYRNVSFSYGEEPVLQNIAFTAEVGNVTAFVGLSGAGKTTLLSLCPRFYEPYEGAVLIDGTDIREVTFASLREQIGIVTQDVILFNDTVANNIAYGAQQHSREEILRAAQIANADEFIRNLPDGFQTVIGERGARLSGGQRQRIAIARAILKNPPIIILDEATSSLDSESEKLVQEAIANLMKDRTTLVIAHRLSTINKANTIIVLEHGRIVERGTHRQLLEHSGIYARLYDMQMVGDGV